MNPGEDQIIKDIMGDSEPESPDVKWKPDTCSLCLKSALHGDRFFSWMLAIGRRTHHITREPMVLDGIFDQHKKLVRLTSCPACKDKVLSFWKYCDPEWLPDGEIKTLARMIWARQKNKGKFWVWIG